jgi:plasmid stabilization system protein ParE
VVAKVIWTPEAESSFAGILEYLRNEWNAVVVRDFIEKVETVVQHIKRYPLAARQSGRADIREAVITKHNLLLYRISGNEIYLLGFWDTWKNPMVH